jgi:hypothetical protein
MQDRGTTDGEDEIICEEGLFCMQYFGARPYYLHMHVATARSSSDSDALLHMDVATASASDSDATLSPGLMW